ncbi:Mrp/NBP35 family ATP-binding protein [Hyphomonas sp. FCG-A18]|uniref:Mrp/NBP35 family ATP-binding protein n=1 Tax=Hyphomonas sp. FCG-A18 TaxID=3080019 RepID=UPI002B2B6964|nr:Mrp/NBP35 family ATP-binding protein [Hyphomonas sp. FCG-A18]
MFWDRKAAKALNEAQIRKTLGNPGWLSGVRIADQGRVTLVIDADGMDRERAETLKLETEARIMSLKGVEAVSTVLTAERGPGSPDIPPMSPASPPAGAPQGLQTHPSPPTKRVKKGARLSDEALQQSQPGQGQVKPIPGISRILAVASAKGGVGKSTVSVNLAAAFAKQGLRVGLLDADIYGPSIPTMLDAVEASPATNKDGKLIPVFAHGIHTLSIGYLSDPDAPMIWRGPIVQSAITQMLNDAAWGTPEDPLDLLIIDTPPGTGEAQLTLAQRVPLTAAIIVTTPQEVALADVRRGAAMFAKTHVPVLGIVETMSWFEDPAGNRHHIMGEGGGQAMAQTLGLPLLSQIPMLQSIREGGDSGKPAALADDSATALFQTLAKDTAISLDALQTKPAPEIVFED